VEVNLRPSRPALAPLPAVTGLLDLFATHPLVACGELHGCQDESEFITALLHHPAFPRTVQVIVVEFGNARHQAVVDRFIAGEPVAARAPAALLRARGVSLNHQGDASRLALCSGPRGLERAQRDR
jgi:hypothetical protein